MSSPHENDNVLVQEYIYDFAVSGGAQGALDLNLGNRLPAGALVKNVYAKVLTAFTSGGAATVAWGDGTDPDGYSGAAKAMAAMTAADAHDGKADSGALVAGLHRVVTEATDGKVELTIAVADLTAGKLQLLVELMLPSVPQ